jgi:hypothetical protein
MFRYYFNVYDTLKEEPEPDGLDLPILHEARSEAITGMRTLVISEVELIAAAEGRIDEVR